MVIPACEDKELDCSRNPAAGTMGCISSNDGCVEIFFFFFYGFKSVDILRQARTIYPRGSRKFYGLGTDICIPTTKEQKGVLCFL